MCAAVKVLRGVRRGWARKATLAALTRRQRTGLRDRVRGHRPSEAARLPLTRVQARQLIDRAGSFLLLAAPVMAQIGAAIAQASAQLAAVSVGIGLAVAAGGVFLFRDARRARHFLDQHPIEDTAPADVVPGHPTGRQPGDALSVDGRPRAHPVNLSVLKNDRARAVRFSTLTAVCSALDCQPGDVFSVDA